MNNGDGKLMRIGVFYDGNYFFMSAITMPSIMTAGPGLVLRGCITLSAMKSLKLRVLTKDIARLLMRITSGGA